MNEVVDQGASGVPSTDLPVAAPARARRGPALVVREPGVVALDDREIAEPGPGEVMVTPLFVGFCGTDLDVISGELDPAYLRYPVVLGHEWSGRVARVGRDVSAFAVGDPVVVEGVRPCSVCAPCRRGETNMCQNYDEMGFTIDGAAGPAVTAPAHFVHRLSESLPLEAGALVEPAAVVLRGLSELDLVPGQRVLIIGDGSVALLAAQLVHLWSPATVTMSGLRGEQADLAATMGVDEFTVSTPAEQGYDVVIEAAGAIAAAETAFASARSGGQVLLLGIAGHGNTAALAVDDVVNHDLRIRGSFSYTAAAWAETVRLLNSGELAPLPLITHRVGLHRYAEALELLSTPDGKPRGKILIDMQAER